MKENKVTIPSHPELGKLDGRKSDKVENSYVVIQQVADRDSGQK